MSDELQNIVESVLLASETPLTVGRIQGLFEDDARPSADEVEQAIEQLKQACEGRGVELCKIGGGYRYQTRRKYAHWIGKLHATRPPKLSRALLETLAIIAYRQPVTRGDIENIRGVAVSTEIMRRLLEREWIKEVGVRDLPGHPALFATTAEFLSHFALDSLADLPPLQQQRELDEIASEMNLSLPTQPEGAPAQVDGAGEGEGDAETPTETPPPVETPQPPAFTHGSGAKTATNS